MRIQTEYTSFKSRWTICRSYDFQMQQQHSQRSSWSSQTALQWFEMHPGMSPALPAAPRLGVGTPRLVDGAPRVVVGAPSLVVGAPRLLVGAPRHVVGAPRLIVAASWCFQACHWRSQVLPWSSPDLLCSHKLFFVVPRCTWRPLH